MGGVNVDGGGKGGRRSLDTEINMIPMIDLLMVTISFLLITAVWVQSSRIDANANVPGPATETPPCTDAAGVPCKPEARLHVQTTDPIEVRPRLEGRRRPSCAPPRSRARRAAPGSERTARAIVTFPALAARIAEEWKVAGVHRDPTDKRFDKAVVHAGNDMPYGEIVAMMDAVSQPKRSIGTTRGHDRADGGLRDDVRDGLRRQRTGNKRLKAEWLDRGGNRSRLTRRSHSCCLFAVSPGVGPSVRRVERGDGAVDGGHGLVERLLVAGRLDDEHLLLRGEDGHPVAVLAAVLRRRVAELRSREALRGLHVARAVGDVAACRAASRRASRPRTRCSP